MKRNLPVIKKYFKWQLSNLTSNVLVYKANSIVSVEAWKPFSALTVYSFCDVYVHVWIPSADDYLSKRRQ